MIMLAARHWAPQWTNHRVIIHSENQAAVQILNKGTTANELIMDELHNLFWLSAAYNFHISATYIEGARNTIADAISRIQDPRHLNTFCALLLDHLPRIAVDQLRLNDHLSVHSRSFVFSRCTGSPAGSALLQEIHNYRAQLFAESTKTTYKTLRDTYLRFCTSMGYCPVPVQPGHLLQYAAFLACTLEASSVRSYLNIISILHKEFGLTNPLLNNWPLKSLLTGINRSKGLTPNQKQPITPAILQQLHSTLDLTTSFILGCMSGCLFRAARIVARTVHSNPAMDVLKWPTLEERRRKSVFKLVKKCLQGQCPQYFKEYFKRNNTIQARTTRQSNLLHPPAVRTEIAKRSFYYYGCILFKELS